ncbi:MAG: hypothetical protein LBQ69_03995 [Treponema sp.]|jgi:hypothetical protein|nr:hypothetical protein [Treponema sp.]
MGNNAEIRQRMETYRKVLLALVWIGAIAGIIGGIIMISYESGGYYSSGHPLRPYGIAVLIVSILGGIISHFLVNVGLAIPFILLNNGDILESMKGNTGSSSGANSSSILPSNSISLSSVGVNDEYIVITNTPLRGEPDESKYVVKPLKADEKVYFQQAVGNWFYVTTSDSSKGWCLAAHLKKV